jgi:carboxyl-terminal processing protease
MFLGNESEGEVERREPARAGISLSGAQTVLLLVALMFTAGGSFMAGYLAGRPERAVRLGVLEEAWRIIQEDFYYPLPSEDEQVYGAIRGLLSTLNDQHTVLLPPVAAARDAAVMQGQVGGVGAIVSMTDQNEVIVVEARRGWPAEQAGVRAGDVIVAVDGTDIAGQTLEEAVSRIRGPLGTSVTLTLRRRGVALPFDLTVTRGQINVYGQLLQDDIAYISFDVFNSTAPADVREALGRLLAESPRALILDLRGNGGGFLNEALDIADLFLPAGLIATERTSAGETRRFTARDGDAGEQVPLVVLVDGRSASASEIVAGAIQDRGRGVLIGERTFGKGSVQGLHLLSDGSQLRVTQGAWYTPDETPIERRGDAPGGLLPDIVVEREAEPQPGVDRILETAIRYIRLMDTF